MLSRVAERLYWSARYLERVENIARLVSVYDDLLYDLPRDIAVSWYNLIEINSDVLLFEERYQVKDERNVLKFLLSDDTNPGSLISSLKMLRENIRTTRDVVPAEMWELVNELDLYAKQNIKQGVNRPDRHTYLNTVIEGCEKLIGLLTGSMSRDAGWHFLIMGRYIERADMNTRILDAANSLIMQAPEEEKIRLGQVVWSKVLKSQSAYLSFRRAMRCAIRGAPAVTFLLTDVYFPRSQYYGLGQIKIAAAGLPRPEAVLSHVEALLDATHGVENSQDLNQVFSDYLNEVQLSLIKLHDQITDTWFHYVQGEAA